MKNIHLLIIILALGISFTGFSQKVKLKKGDVLVDEALWLKYDGCGGFDSTCSVSNLNGEEIIFMNHVSIEGAGPVMKSGTRFDLTYYEVKFLGMKAVVEFEDDSAKKILELIYKGGLVQADGTLDEEKVQRMVEKYGTPVSDRLNRPTGNNQTIIIKEDQRPSGVNINIGR
jgi:hypothetical protein